MFFFMDQDDDGQVSKEEFIAFSRTALGFYLSVMPEETREAHGAAIKAVIDDPDAVSFLKRYQNYDQKDTGFFTVEELIAAHAKENNITA